jgi:2,4-didehydro-3-deoxy-L-rhamnonate hydrolase
MMTKAPLVRALGVLALGVGLAACGGGADAQSGGQVVPYKLGTFERNNQTFLGLVLQDTQVLDIAQANAAWEGQNASAPRMTVPADMTGLIAAYDDGWKARLAAIASAEAAATSAPAYRQAMDALRVLPPVRPSIILNAGGNYAEHSQGILEQQARAAGEPPPPPPVSTAVSAPGIWERPDGDTRDNPYLFLKSPTVVTGAFDPIHVPRGRDRIDFECEFAVVIGRPAKYVPVERAADHIFGYTIEIDVSDRGGRGDRKMGGSDWLVGKNHDTFGPLGPVIVPKEFHPNPTNTRHTFTLNGEVMQDSNTSRMTHDIYELVHYASNILTLRPGDVIAGGSPAGTNIERAEPRWMRDGDTAVCEIEGIGTQRHSVINEPVASN